MVSTLSAAPQRLATREIIAEAANQFDVSVEAIVGPGRQKPIVRVRQAAMWAVLKLRPDLLRRRVGAAFNRDHSTVTASRDVVEKLRVEDGEFREATDALLRTCQSLAWAKTDRAIALAAAFAPAMSKHAEAAADLAPTKTPRRRPKAPRRPFDPWRGLCRLEVRHDGHQCQIEPGRFSPNDWDRALFEPWAERKARLARERAEGRAVQS